jgi:hypothetical protein
MIMEENCAVKRMYSESDLENTDRYCEANRHGPRLMARTQPPDYRVLQEKSPAVAGWAF